MRYVPVDMSKIETVLGFEVEEKMKDRNTGEIAVDPAGTPKWTITLILKNEGDKSMVPLTVTAAQRPQVEPLSPVVLENPRVMFWQNNGRSGLAWSADSVTSESTARRSGSSGSGGSGSESS